MFKAFSSDAAYQRIIDKLVMMQGYGQDDRPALLQGVIANGTWYEMVLPPLTSTPAALSLVKRTRDVASSDTVDSLAEAVSNGANILVVGTDASARSAVLNAVAGLIPASQRVVVVECGCWAWTEREPRSLSSGRWWPAPCARVWRGSPPEEGSLPRRPLLPSSAFIVSSEDR